MADPAAAVAASLPGDPLAANLLLQPHQPFQQRFRPRRTAGNVHVDRNHQVDAAHHVVAVLEVRPAGDRAGPHRDHVLRLRPSARTAAGCGWPSCRSPCRRRSSGRTAAGWARNAPAPNRSRSNRPAPADIISIAQQAMPKVIGHRLPCRAQLIDCSRVVNTTPSSKRPSIQGRVIRCRLHLRGQDEAVFKPDQYSRQLTRLEPALATPLEGGTAVSSTFWPSSSENIIRSMLQTSWSCSASLG